MNPEEIFPPKAGGMVDTVRRQKQAEADQLEQLNATPVVEDPNGYEAVRVRIDEPDLGTARTFTLSASNPVALILPRDEFRREALLLAVDNDIWLSYNKGAADDLAGTSGAGVAGYLPAGIAIPIHCKAPMWASPTTTATSSRVTVIVARDCA